MEDFWINLTCEPSVLLLSWETPVGHKDRSRWVVGRIERIGSDAAIFRYLDDADFSEANYGRSRAALKEAGYLGYPAFDPARLVHEASVIETFMRRLPPRTRPDFPRYLEQFRIQAETRASDPFLLGATEARLPGDGFALINPLDPSAADCDLVIELAGYRWYREHHPHLAVGDALKLVPEPNNEYDSNAIAVQAGGQTLAHINRVQAPAVLAWMAGGHIALHLSRLNGTSERPRAFAFMQYRKSLARAAA